VLDQRITKLEHTQQRGRVHRMISMHAETQEEAIRRYERETGVKVGPNDFVIRRVIVSPEMYQVGGHA